MKRVQFEDPLNRGKPAQPHLEAKIKVQREIMNSDDSSLPPLKGIETVPEGWKIRPEKHKKQEPLTDHQDVSLPCNYKAPDKDVQLRHTRRRHEEIRYSCDFCSYSTTQKRILKKHQKIEHRENYYSCIYCNHKADWKDS